MSTASQKPLLHHINADSTWLLQIPHPLATKTNDSRTYFNILLDPWLTGPQSDVASWFSSQEHAEPSAYATIDEVQSLALEAEPASSKANEGAGIDVVAISHEFTDHCHKETLLELPKETPVYAPGNAAALIRSWNHFDSVMEMDLHKPSDRESRPQHGIPSWVSLSRIQDANDALYYHSAILISWSAPGTDCNYVLYTPHGIVPSAVEELRQEPGMKALCLIHGMHDVQLYKMQQLNLGGHNGLGLFRKLQPRYWIGTHDEVKVAGGLVKHVLTRKIITIDEAMAQESDPSAEKVPFEAMPNGGRKILA